MAENPGKSFFTMEKCSQCGLQPAVFLHSLWHKGQYFHICTACVLNLHQGAFCPVCFKIHDDQENLSNSCVKCCGCEAICHLSCVPLLSSFFSNLPATSASSSTSRQGFRVLCPFCSNPNFKIFNFSWDERTNGIEIDGYLASQMLAAALISNHSVKKAAKMASVRAQILCKEAVEARQNADEALQKLHDLTSASHDEDRKSE